MLEAAIALPLLLLVAIGMVQFALYMHAETVVIGAVQDGARVAAAAQGSVPAGIQRTQTLLQAGLGADARHLTVSGADDGELVTIVARGRLPIMIPGVAVADLPLEARTSESKERFRPGGGP